MEDLNAQHQKTVDLRRQISETEQAVQSATALASNAKFHEQGLEQEIEQLKRSNDWLEKELKAKSDEYAKYRKEKTLRVVELQRENEDASGEIDTLRKTETSLRRRIDELMEKVDETLQQKQNLQEAGARKDESFKLELDAATRLQELTKRSAETEHRRQQELLAELDAAREEAADQTGRLAAEVETEHEEREAAEARIAELEVQVEQLQSELETGLEQQRRPRTPIATNGVASNTPQRGEASTLPFSPGSSRLKAGLSMTQIYSSHNEMVRRLDTEKRRNEELAATIDTMIEEIEARSPEIEETRIEKARLESEVAEMSSLIDVVTQERDQALKAAKKWEGQVRAKAIEADVLRQQLRDLSSQVKVLLMEAHVHAQGQNDMSVEERARLEEIAAGNVGEQNDENTATAQFISQNLVSFRNISELQEQNANLLKVTREIGERMEHEESLQKQAEAARNWEDLQGKYEHAKDEIKSLATQSQSYIRERDMFRRMLTHRGQIPRGAESMFDESIVDDEVSSAVGHMQKSAEESPNAKDHADYGKLLKEYQTHFDAYKQEAEIDKRTLKDQVDNMSRENSSLRSEVAKSNSHIALAQERYEMLQANYRMLRSENSELQKRTQASSDNVAKQELRVQQVAEELVEARGLLESMRSEISNLKAEKEFWKSIEKRINEDNQNLLSERNRLTTLSGNLQSVINDKEHSENETRRRLQDRIESLEKDLRATNAKLDDAVEENKRAVQRREFESDKNQKRIDDLITSLNSVREELVAAKTTRDHLSARVEELTIQLRSAEERATVVHPSNKHSGPSGQTMQAQEGNEEGESSLNKEQSLRVEISELRRDLDLSKADLTNAKAQIEQYKAISQASEDELASLNETQELYRSETEAAIAQRDSRIKDFEQRAEDLASELRSSNEEMMVLRNEQAEHSRRLEEQRNAFEAEIAKIKDVDERHAAAAQYYQEDLKAQAEIAQQAQQSYENELVKHADAAKALQKVRADFNDLKLELVEARTQLETVRSNYSNSEESWQESRDRLERELSEQKSARADLKSQNDHLHQQLESFGRRTQQTATLDVGEPSVSSSEPGIGNLQEVIKYLRREKEIVDVQLELASQEAKRLRQQLEYSQTQLDEIRLKLNKHQRSEADAERANLDHKKLMDTINDLNTLRESSVTLRAERGQAQANLAARTKELEDTRAQIDPLHVQLRELTATNETQQEEIRLQKENADRWQERAQNVLQKYDRVDPAELEALKERLQAAESARDELTAAQQSLQEQADSAASQIAQAERQSTERIETMKANLTTQFKTRSKQLTDRIKEKDAALQAASNECQEFQSQLDAVTAERDAAKEQLATSTDANRKPQAPHQEEGQINGDSDVSQDREQLQTTLREAENKAQQLEQEVLRLQNELQTSNARVAELEGELVNYTLAPAANFN